MSQKGYVMAHLASSILTISSHPAHPAFVHFPITFTAITGALDGIYWMSKIPATAGVVNSVCEYSLSRD